MTAGIVVGLALGALAGLVTWQVYRPLGTREFREQHARAMRGKRRDGE